MLIELLHCVLKLLTYVMGREHRARRSLQQRDLVAENCLVFRR